MKTLTLSTVKFSLTLVLGVLLSVNVILGNGTNAKNKKVKFVKEIVTEPTIKLENWMLSADYFNLENLENKTKLEDWMLDASVFIQKTPSEEPVELKDWMTDYTLWQTKTVK